jgi:hypothetical protein
MARAVNDQGSHCLVRLAGNGNAADGPRHCTAAITSKGKMAGALISDVKTDVEAERVGDCTQ